MYAFNFLFELKTFATKLQTIKWEPIFNFLRKLKLFIFPFKGFFRINNLFGSVLDQINYSFNKNCNVYLIYSLSKFINKWYKIWG